MAPSNVSAGWTLPVRSKTAQPFHSAPPSARAPIWMPTRVDLSGTTAGDLATRMQDFADAAAKIEELEDALDARDELIDELKCQLKEMKEREINPDDPDTTVVPYDNDDNLEDEDPVADVDSDELYSVVVNSLHKSHLREAKLRQSEHDYATENTQLRGEANFWKSKAKNLEAHNQQQRAKPERTSTILKNVPKAAMPIPRARPTLRLAGPRRWFAVEMRPDPTGRSCLRLQRRSKRSRRNMKWTWRDE